MNTAYKRVSLCRINNASLDAVTGDEYIKALALDAMLKGAGNYPEDDATIYKIYTDKLPLDDVKYIINGEHGDVEDHILYIEVEDMEALVPIGVENWSVDGEQLTWSQWVKSPPALINGKYYIATSNCVGYEGYLPVSKIIPVLNLLHDRSTLPTPTEE